MSTKKFPMRWGHYGGYWRRIKQHQRLYIEYEKNGRLGRIGFWVMPPAGLYKGELQITGGESRLNSRRIYLPEKVDLKDLLRRLFYEFRTTVDAYARVKRVYFAVVGSDQVRELPLSDEEKYEPLS